MNNRITELLKIKYPIIQGGMVWCCGWRLASAVSNNGGLGLLGAGSMTPEILREHIRKCKEATKQPYGVNVPLLYHEIEGIMKVILDEGVPVVFTSAGNPKTWTQTLKSNGVMVVHVVSSSKFACKAEDAGVDAVVAEGFEAGGHNGREETTTMTLIPQVRRATTLPLIAAGGIATGEAILAAMCLGADGVQIGTRFALSEESSASPAFKQLCVSLNEGDTLLALKKISPTRMVKNVFFERVKEAEDKGADVAELQELLGRGRAKTGIFDGDLENGLLEIGQIASGIRQVEPVEVIMKSLTEGLNNKLNVLKLMDVWQ
ncbi:MAG: nitronate monooxygenase [Tannerella sp.]|jgi:enoyl-[acyl-carrier protein] reductase II|nr:nitronate monooxygenase [Tannerella sp.]